MSTLFDRQAASSTAWTPAEGDVVGWPFLWRDQEVQVYKRPCLALAWRERWLLVGLSSLKDGYEDTLNKRQAALVRWMDGEGRRERESLLNLESLQFNLVEPEALRCADECGNARHWGAMDADMLRHARRQVLGRLKMDPALALEGYEQVAPCVYAPVRLRAQAGPLVLRPDGDGYRQGLA